MARQIARRCKASAARRTRDAALLLVDGRRVLCQVALLREVLPTRLARVPPLLAVHTRDVASQPRLPLESCVAFRALVRKLTAPMGDLDVGQQRALRLEVLRAVRARQLPQQVRRVMTL